jgi:hypothetical protein
VETWEQTRELGKLDVNSANRLGTWCEKEEGRRRRIGRRRRRRRRRGKERRGDVGRGRKFVDACVVVCLQVRSPFVASLAINFSVVEMSGR